MVFVIGNLVGIIPGATGEWLMKLSPGNAGSTLATVESFNPILLSPGPASRSSWPRRWR